MNTPSTLLSRQSGVVLPVVLVVLVVVTTLVLTQVRRGTVDERLAGNWSRSISGETSAESTLRWCEMELQREPRLWDGVILAANFAATPAWRTNTWNQAASILTTQVFRSGLSTLIENTPLSSVNPLPSSMGVASVDSTLTGAFRMGRYEVVPRKVV